MCIRDRNASNLSTKKDCPDLTTPEGKAEAEAMKARPYRELLGSLLWIHRTGGPSIAYAVHHLCMFANNPSEKHWKQAQHVLKYLKYHVDNNDGSKQVMPLGIGLAEWTLIVHRGSNSSVEGPIPQ